MEIDANRDYLKEMVEVWAHEGEQAAYDLAVHLLQEINRDVTRLKRQESAIRKVGEALREDEAVDVSADPVDPGPGLDPIEPSERPRIILEAAKEAYEDRESGHWSRTGTGHIKTQEVLDHLRSQGFDLGVQQPLAVIGTVLASAKGFKRIARNTFEVIQDQDPMMEPDDLPF